LEISRYTESELIGQPHNVIRHPDMPRSIFKLLWDRISSGKELFAYVVNLASDGAHYWVYAHVTPSFGPGGSIIGYHSNRRAPDREAVEEIGRVYSQLRAEESRHSRPSDALAAGTAWLTAALTERGTTYDQWVWGLTTSSGGAR
jgi:hypothetical protein